MKKTLILVIQLLTTYLCEKTFLFGTAIKTRCRTLLETEYSSSYSNFIGTGNPQIYTQKVLIDVTLKMFNTQISLNYVAIIKLNKQFPNYAARLQCKALSLNGGNAGKILYIFIFRQL